MRNKKGVILFGIVVAIMTLFSLSTSAQDEKTPTITKSFELNQPGTLNASSAGGGITVKTHDAPRVEIQAFVRKKGKLVAANDPDLDEILEDFDLDFSKEGTTINAIVERELSFMSWSNVNISLTITVPERMSCEVSSSGGGIRASGVEGVHSFKSSGGGITLEGITGTTTAKSSGGGIKVEDHTGDLEVRSSGGGITIREVQGNINTHSSGGGVTLEDINGKVEAGSSGGGVTVNDVTGSVKANSSGGSVKVSMKKLTGELSLNSSGGGISATIQDGDDLGLDLDLSSDRVYIDLKNFSGKAEKDRIKGSMNGGGIPVTMHSSGGNVNVKFE